MSYSGHGEMGDWNSMRAVLRRLGKARQWGGRDPICVSLRDARSGCREASADDI